MAIVPAAGVGKTGMGKDAPPIHRTVSRFPDDDDHGRRRAAMVKSQIEARGVRDPRVLEALKAVPRHVFVPEPWREEAYGDFPLPIGSGQTISQPYIVAFMTEALRLRGDERVLEIGTGCGYQAAVLSLLAREVHTVECRPDLAARAQDTLSRLGLTNVHGHVGNGWEGWPPAAPYDAIMVTAAAPRVPEALLEQMNPQGGRMIIPVGHGEQWLIRIQRHGDEWTRERLIPVRFVPLVPAAPNPNQEGS